MKTLRIQQWNGGEILKTLQGKYQFVKKNYKSSLYPSVAELVKYESDKATKRSTANSKSKSATKETSKPAEATTSEDKK